MEECPKTNMLSEKCPTAAETRSCVASLFGSGVASGVAATGVTVAVVVATTGVVVVVVAVGNEEVEGP